MEDSVVFPGLVNYETLPYYYNAADVCVLPSYYESFGLVPLESLSCGIPVVATDVGNLRNIIRQGETGYVLPDSSPEFMAGKIRSTLSGNNPHFQDQFKIRASVSRYGWENIASTIIQEFHSLTVRDPVRT